MTGRVRRRSDDAGPSGLRKASDGVPAWEYRIGFRGTTVHAYERPDRGYEVYVRWTNPRRHGRDRRQKMKLGIRVRTPDGRVERALVDVVQRRVHDIYHDLIVGKFPGDPAEAPSLTLREGFLRALDLERGIYPTDSRHRRDTQRAGRTAQRVLGADTTWEQLRDADTRQLGRRLAQEHLRTGRGGLRQTEVVVAALFRVAAWLRQDKAISSSTLVPEHGWRARLAEDWSQITGTRPIVHRPRHSEHELGKLLLTQHLADPRIALAVAIGAELRVGQVLQTMRTALDLEATQHAPFGTVAVPGRGRKGGEIVNLTPEQRTSIDQALAGHLVEFEGAYERRQLDDYPLFPGGKLRDGRCRPRNTSVRLNRRTALDLFREWERVAGVPSVPGRGWYGLRRVTADLAEDLPVSERVKDKLGGWSAGSGTRTRVYVDHERERDRTGAAESRDVIRQAAQRRAREG